jgi:hypothetical protein
METPKLVVSLTVVHGAKVAFVEQQATEVQVTTENGLGIWLTKHYAYEVIWLQGIQ